ncbi:MAG: IS110 family transposase, partial [Candidatus Entotheonellia bacterium]
MAVAAMVVSPLHGLTRREPSHDLGAHYCDEQRGHYVVDRLTRRIERLGYHVPLEPRGRVHR